MFHQFSSMSNKVYKLNLSTHILDISLDISVVFLTEFLRLNLHTFLSYISISSQKKFAQC